MECIGSPFVYSDRGGWPASLPYICKIRVSVAMHGHSIRNPSSRKGSYGQNMGVLKKMTEIGLQESY